MLSPSTIWGCCLSMDVYENQPQGLINTVKYLLSPRLDENTSWFTRGKVAFCKSIAHFNMPGTHFSGIREVREGLFCLSLSEAPSSPSSSSSLLSSEGVVVEGVEGVEVVEEEEEEVE